MKNSILHDKALDFAADIVNMYESFLLLKKDNTIAKQLLRSAPNPYGRTTLCLNRR